MLRSFSEADRAFLDLEYNARLIAPEFDKEAVYQAASASSLKRGERVPDLVYDDWSGSKLDIYPAQPGSPLFVWIHGGYWRSSTKEENAFVVPGFVEAGISVATVDYTLAPRVSLDEIVRQVRRSIAWVHRNAAVYGIDARRLHIGGHSAGGQLVGMLLADGWRSQLDLPDDLFGVAATISGLHDLRPLVHSFVNEPLKLDEAAAIRNSPLLDLPRQSRAHLIASCGQRESDEFKRQTQTYLQRWTSRGFSGEEVVMPGFHHFDIILELEKPGNALFDAIRRGIAERH